jgi:hypothetical protein
MHRALLISSIITVVAARDMSFAMTKDELAQVLRKANLPQAEVVSELRGAVEESSFDFLNGGTFLEATLEGNLRPEVLRFVRQRDRLIPIGTGVEGQKRIGTDVDMRVRSPESALEYVRWLLTVTREGGLWLVGTVDDVPFVTVLKDQKDRRAELDDVRKSLEPKIETPRAEASGPVFVVHQDAVLGHDLVRFTVTVTKLGSPTIEMTTIARDLPVVYAGPL